jgi:hypothetical protein
MADKNNIKTENVLFDFLTILVYILFVLFFSSFGSRISQRNRVMIK